MCLVLCHLVTCVDSCNCHSNLDIELSLHHQDPPWATSLSPHQASTPSNHNYVLQLHHSVILRMLYKWNYTVF